MKRLISSFIALAVIILFAVACGGGGGGTGGGGDTNGPAVPAPNPGVLRLPGSAPQTLDPALTGDVGSAFYVVEIFGGLLTWVPEREAGDEATCYDFPDAGVYCMVPDIAQGIPGPEFNDDGTVSYTFKLRQDVTFHRGRKVTAHDFKYSLERALDPRLGSTTAELYLWDIVGARTFNRGPDPIAEKLPSDCRKSKTSDYVAGIEVVDDYTLKLTIERYNAVFLLKLTYPTAFAVDCNQAPSRQAYWWSLPNGTGPFRCSECRVERSKVTLTPNKNYHLGSPKLQEVVVSFSGGSAPTLYTDGDVDVTGVALVEINDVRSPNNPLSRELKETSDVSTTYLAFNTQQAPFNDARVRRAFAMAIDKDLIVRQDLKDAVSVAHTVVPPTMPNYDPPLDAGIPYDPAGARKLLSEAGYNGNFPAVKLLSGGRGGTNEVTARVIAMLEQNLGITVTTDSGGDFGAFLGRLHRGDFQMTIFGWVADYPDPEDFLDLKFHSDRNVANRETRYENPEVDRLLEQAREAKDESVRMKLYQQAERLIVEDAPWIPLYHGKNIVLVKPYVTGYDPPPMVIPFLRYVEVK